MEETKPNIIVEKSFAFSIRIVKLYQWLGKNRKDINSLARQLLRSGTSVGANIEEAIASYSKKEFAAKMSISHKEIRETLYWLRLLHATDYIETTHFNSVYKDGEEILKILSAIVKTSRA